MRPGARLPFSIALASIHGSASAMRSSSGSTSVCCSWRTSAAMPAGTAFAVTRSHWREDAAPVSLPCRYRQRRPATSLTEATLDNGTTSH